MITNYFANNRKVLCRFASKSFEKVSDYYTNTNRQFSKLKYTLKQPPFRILQRTYRITQLRSFVLHIIVQCSSLYEKVRKGQGSESS